MRWSPLWTVPHAGVRSVQCSFLNQYMTGKMFLETSSLISGLCWVLIYLYFWSSSGLSLKEKFGQPKTLRSVPIPTAWGNLRQLNSCPKAMFLKISSQDPKISTWAQWLFWQEGQQEGFCTASHLSPRKDILPLKDNSQRPFWDAPVSPGFSWWWMLVTLPKAEAPLRPFGSPVAMATVCSFMIWLLSTSLNQKRFWSFYIFSDFNSNSLVGGFEFEREMIHCEEKLPEIYVVHCWTLLFFKN